MTDLTANDFIDFLGRQCSEKIDKGNLRHPPVFSDELARIEAYCDVIGWIKVYKKGEWKNG